MQINPRLIKIDKCIYRVSIKALILDRHKLLLVKEWDDEWWSFPGGGIEHGESIQEALRREIEEELGVTHENIESDLEIIHTGIGAIVEKLPMVNLFVRVDIPIEEIKSTSDVVEYRWFEFDELTQLLIVPTTLDNDRLMKTIQNQMNLIK